MNKIEFEEGRAKVFADLGLEDAKKLQTRDLIGIHLVQLLKAKNMQQKEIGELLGLKPAEASHLFNRHFTRFSTDKLLSLLEILEQKMSIQISPRKEGELFHEVTLA